MEGRAEAVDGEVEGGHGVSHLVAGGVGVEAAVEAVALCDQMGEGCYQEFCVFIFSSSGS